MNRSDSNSQPSLPDRKVLNPQLVYTYTRSQAIADGLQIEVTKTAAEAGICFPVFITRGVYDQYVAVPAGVTGQDDHVPRSGLKTWGNHIVAGSGSPAGRLWDIVWMLRFAIIRSKPGDSRMIFALYVRNSDSHPARLVKLIATAGAVDIDDPRPAITVMLPEED
jgi:hypothetical protein